MSSCHYSMIRVFQCEDTLTGILTGVYDAWASRLGHEHVRLRSGEYEDLELFCEYTEVAPDLTKAGKVLRTIQTRLGEEAYEMIAYAAAYPHTGKADAIYRMIVVGLHLPDGRIDHIPIGPIHFQIVLILYFQCLSDIFIPHKILHYMLIHRQGKIHPQHTLLQRFP